VTKTLKPTPLSLKPDMEEAARRWDAFYAGEIIDRPLIVVTAPRDSSKPRQTRSTYYERVHGDIEAILDHDIAVIESTYYGGEAIPALWISFGPDEVAVLTGAELKWSKDSQETNWSVPYVKRWEDVLPLRLQEDHPLWQRLLKYYRRAAERTAGKMLINHLDLHSNMDLLAAIRGPQQLCLDCLEQPEMLDQAMLSSRALFKPLWDAIAEAGKMNERGYFQVYYGRDGAAMLQCDFSCMISPAMFRRWVLPALEEEASIVKHVFYHWDGPAAVIHTPDLATCPGLAALGYVPGAGRGGHIEYLDLMKRVQSYGKAVQFSGTPDEIKRAHRELKPNLVSYHTGVKTPQEAEALLEWFVKNT
jgi:5-methyltetrahydrofolate--homocysteine methyltransferase